MAVARDVESTPSYTPGVGVYTLPGDQDCWIIVTETGYAYSVLRYPAERWRAWLRRRRWYGDARVLCPLDAQAALGILSSLATATRPARAESPGLLAAGSGA
jgi:hypothetical protein